MRFRINFQLEFPQYNKLPFNYQYPLSSWIYRTLGNANAEYASWLHDKGYKYHNHFFKLFTFSGLNIPKFKADGDRMLLQSDSISLEISFFADEAVRYFIQGLFVNQELALGDKISRVELKVTDVLFEPEPELDTDSVFSCLSPICVSEASMVNGKMRAKYLSPNDEGYETLFYNTLIRKYLSTKEAAVDTGQDQVNSLREQCKLQVLSDVKHRLVTIKQGTPEETKIKGYLFDFRMKAPEELIRFAYDAGVGEKGSGGFGMVKI